jgi:hypothetical protein
MAEHFNMADGNQQWNKMRTDQVEEIKYKPDNAKTSKKKLIIGQIFYFYKFKEIKFIIHLIRQVIEGKIKGEMKVTRRRGR